MQTSNKTKWIIGVDEAGRGPIAGPVAVGGCIIKTKHIRDIEAELIDRFMKGELKDSKKLTESTRNEIYQWVLQKQKLGVLDFAVSLVHSTTIDKFGITTAVSKGISRTLTKILNKTVTHDEVIVLLDGLLRAPMEFNNQKTIIKGDETESIIALASIMAKVRRDNYMRNLENRCKKNGCIYGFDRHKGYGTTLHYKCIKKYGLSKHHRLSFCKNLK
jgi:ribonuclease HII